MKKAKKPTIKDCPLHTACSLHSYFHGAEAEELRSGIEALIARSNRINTRELQELLDRVDARDSAAYIEAKARDDA